MTWVVSVLVYVLLVFLGWAVIHGGTRDDD